MKTLKLITFIILVIHIDLSAQEKGASYWNNSTPLVSYRLPPPPVGYKPTLVDLDGDGDPDIIHSITIRNTPVLWIDDDDDLRPDDLEGDTDSDCLLVDVNRDGRYCDYQDIAVDWIDTDRDGLADMQVFVENAEEGARKWGPGHYMWVIDTDKDNVFNHIDWNTFELRAWFHEGSSNFIEDYVGKSTFLKAHTSSYHMEDLRLNWENPFLFFDPDKDGLTEMAFRALDRPVNRDSFFAEGRITYVGISYDLDNDNAPGNEFDYDMSFRFYGEGKGFDYMDQVHKFDNVRVAEADSFFKDPRWRQISELIYPDYDSALYLTYNKGEWDNVYFSYDEDDDSERWERVEFYDPKNLFKTGGRNGGLDDNPQADAIGDRGEWDMDNSGKGKIYVSKFDGRIHLYGAEWGAWRLDQLAFSYQGWGGLYDSYTTGRQRLQREFYPFSTFKYEDSDGNGFFDKIKMDIDGDTIFDKTISLLELKIDDRCEIIPTAGMDYEDFSKLHSTMSNNIWSRAQTALRVADQQGLNTSWYAFMKDPKSEYQKYSYGYWLQFYIYMDLLDQSGRVKKGLNPNKIHKAYFGADWGSLLN